MLGDDLYVAGRFTDAAGIPEADYIAKWDGQAWSALGSGADGQGALNGWVNALAVSGSDLYVGGSFTDVAGLAEGDFVARWDGTNWSAVGSAGAGDAALDCMRPPARTCSSGWGVEALAVAGEDLYVGGFFNDAGGIPEADRIARWNGTTWSGLGSGGSGDGAITGTGHVKAIAVAGDDVYVGGQFLNLSGLPEADHIARWDGNAWSALGSDGRGNGPLGQVSALALLDGELYAGGAFSDRLADGAAVGGVARWDGASWSRLGDGMPSDVGRFVGALAVADRTLYAGASLGVARWDGTTWSQAIPDSANVIQITSMAPSGDDLYVAGNYGGDGVGKWDGSQWSALIPGDVPPTTARRPYRDSVPTPPEINTDPVVVAQSVVLAAAIVLFVPFPGGLFNSTLEANYAEVAGWARSIRRRMGRLLAGIGRTLRRASRGAMGRASTAATARPPDESTPSGMAVSASSTVPESPANPFWTSPRGIASFVVAMALLVCLLDPTFGLEVVSFATFIGVTAGLVVTLVAYSAPQAVAYRVNQISFGVRAIPGTLAVGAACVLISRATNFQPGYLYGLIIGLVAVRQLSGPTEAKAAAVATTVMLVGAGAAWLALAWIDGQFPAGAEPGFASVILQTALVTVVVAGLEGAALGMLPLRFLAGDKVRRWNRRIWATLFGIALVGFWHVLVNPSSGYLADSSRTPVVTVIGLLVFFGVGSTLFWAYFRYRPPRRAPSLVT